MRSLRGRVAVLVVTLLVAVLHRWPRRVGGHQRARGGAGVRARARPAVDRPHVRRAVGAGSEVGAQHCRRSPGETRAPAALTEQRGATDAVLASTSATLSAEDRGGLGPRRHAAAADRAVARPARGVARACCAPTSTAWRRSSTPPSGADAAGSEPRPADVDDSRASGWRRTSRRPGPRLSPAPTHAVASMRRVQAVTFGLLLLVILGIAVFLRAWVVAPVGRSRGRWTGRRRAPTPTELDCRSTSTDLTEIRSMGRSAEDMRRRLVDEVRESQRASEALRDESPTVDAVRRVLYELQPAPAPGYDVVGSVSPAHGVLAGDWWDAIACPDGSTALVTRRRGRARRRGRSVRAAPARLPHGAPARRVVEHRRRRARLLVAR